MHFTRRLGRYVRSVALTRDGCKLAVCTDDRVAIFDAAGDSVDSFPAIHAKDVAFIEGKLLVLSKGTLECYDDRQSVVWARASNGCRINANQAMVAVSGGNDCIFYDGKGRERSIKLDENIACAFPSARSAFACAHDGIVIFSYSGKILWKAHFDEPKGLDVYGKKLVCFNDREFSFFEDGKLKWTKTLDVLITSVALSENFLALGTDDGVFIFDHECKSPKRRLQGNLICDVALDAYGSRYAACYGDKVSFGKWNMPCGISEKYCMCIVEESAICNTALPIILNKEMTEEASELMSACSSEDELAMELYSFVRRKVAYRPAARVNFPDETLRLGLGNCVEAALLYIALARYCGLEAGYKYSDDHACAWVRVEGREVVIDAQALSDDRYAGFGICEKMNYLDDDELARYIIERNGDAKDEGDEGPEGDIERAEMARGDEHLGRGDMVRAQGRAERHEGDQGLGHKGDGKVAHNARRSGNTVPSSVQNRLRRKGAIL